MKTFKEFLNEASNIEMVYVIVDRNKADYGMFEGLVWDLEEDGKVSSDDTSENDNFDMVYNASKKDHGTLQKQMKSLGWPFKIEMLMSQEEKVLVLARAVNYILDMGGKSDNLSSYKSSARNLKGKIEYKVTKNSISIQDDQQFGIKNKNDRELQNIMKSLNISDFTQLAKMLNELLGAKKNNKINK